MRGRCNIKGILFKPDMIKAIVEGRKTQTRRAINPQPSHFDKGILEALGKEAKWTGSNRYQVGETVYIKEAFSYWGNPICLERDKLIYRIDGQDIRSPRKWTNPLFMPEWATRYFIKITDVRPERLQAITPEDCLTEGISVPYQSAYESLTTDYRSPTELLKNYQTLWNSINPKHPWAKNDWVWVYSFKKVERNDTILR